MMNADYRPKNYIKDENFTLKTKILEAKGQLSNINKPAIMLVIMKWAEKISWSSSDILGGKFKALIHS